MFGFGDGLRVVDCGGVFEIFICIGYIKELILDIVYRCGVLNKGIK